MTVARVDAQEPLGSVPATPLARVEEEPEHVRADRESSDATTNEDEDVNAFDDDEDLPGALPDGDSSDARYTIGICAMDKKARSKPMKEILSRLPRGLFRVVVFGDETILHAPIEAWPRCDALIAFFSTGFPLDKAKAYVRLRAPVVVNDLDKQDLLMDRRDVYRILQEHHIPLPRHVFLSRDGYRQEPVGEIVEAEDYIEVNGVRITKPFVEKPVDGEDHNIHIYYPMSAGGGCKKLFRKVGNRSSEFDPRLNAVRKTGSFIYEEFLSTQGTDVKVYTVGPNYAHAEARKSPVLDGRVLRDADGKEVRYPVILSPKEKEIAFKVCRAFGQTICGFDILRVHDASYVCDVNGWSFVKNSEKYYDDCATLLANYLEKSLEGSTNDPFSLATFSSPTLRIVDGTPELSDPSMPLADDHEIPSGAAVHEEELRCVLAVIRHGDRTPKQKMKMIVCHPSFLQFYEERVGNSKKKDLKIKAVADLEKLLGVSKELIRLFENREPDFLEFLADREQNFGEDSNDRMKGYRTLRDVLQRWQLCGINRKVQLKPKDHVKTEGTNGEQIKQASKLQLILKWGGDLTHTGVEQAERLGQRFRQMMYPGGDGGLIRLHSTYRHDLKIYTSDEGRVQKTAASFAKGLLELEGDIIPILVGLVLKSKDADSMLDQSGSEAQEIIMKVKQRLHTIIHRGDNCAQLMDSSSRLIRSVAQALTAVDQPIKKMEVMHKLLSKLKDQLTKMIQEKSQVKAELTKKKNRQDQDPLTRVSRQDNSSVHFERSRSASASRSRHGLRPGGHSHAYASDEQKAIRFANIPEEDALYPEPCGRETLDMMRERWAKLYRDFYSKKTETYDLSKIPDIHDCIRYDGIHNSHLHLTNIRELLDIAASLAHALVPQEYGINENEKIYIGSAMCRTLMMKIKDDLDLARGLRIGTTHRLNPSYAKNKHEIKSKHRSVRTRLYFTSESHLHTLLNVLRYGREDSPIKAPIGEEAKKWIEDIPELCYMTHFVVRVFERFQFAHDDPRRFRLEISFSQGADQDALSEDVTKHLEVAPLKTISREGLNCQELVDYLADAIAYAEHNQMSNLTANTKKGGDNQQAEYVNGAVDVKNGGVSQLKRTGYVLSNSSSSGDPEGPEEQESDAEQQT